MSGEQQSITVREEQSEAYLEMDRRDEQQIVAELGGAYLDEMVYDIRGEVRLSWAGIKECVRRMGKIKLEKPEVSIQEGKYIIMVKAIDTENKIEMWGGAQQSIMMTKKDGSQEEDPFSFVKCLSKSQRNACRAVVPEIMLQKLIQAHRDAKTGKPQAREESMRDAAISTITEFIQVKPDENRPLVEAMVKSQGWEGMMFFKEMPDEILAFLVTEIDKIEEKP